MFRNLVIVFVFVNFILIFFSCANKNIKHSDVLVIPNSEIKDTIKNYQKIFKTNPANVETKQTLDTMLNDKNSFNSSPTDSIVLKQKNNQRNIDTLYVFEQDTLSAGALTDIVVYSSKDSAQINVPKNAISLYTEATSKYGDIESKSDRIIMNQKTQNIYLLPPSDTQKTVLLKNKTKFKQGGTDYLSDTVVFNYNSKKGLTKNSFTVQGDLFVWSQVSKKINETDVYSQNMRFSTCGLDHPHFGFSSSKGMFKKDKVGVTDATYVEIEGITFPVPIFPFALFPISLGARDGLIVPMYVQSPDRGIGLQNGGYYMKFGDYVDLKISGEIFSYGSYGYAFNSNYRYLYHFSGNVNYSFQKIYSGKPGDLNRTSSDVFSLSVSHQSDAKAMPNANFTIGLNIQSTQYNTLQIGKNPNQNFQNQIGSRLSFSQRFKKIPLTFSISGSHSQNNQTKRYDVSLPDMNINLMNILPLQNVGNGSAWYNKLAFNHTVTTKGTTFFYDSLLTPLLTDNFRWGVNHNPSISLPLPALGPFVFTPSISYSEVWMDRKTQIVYNALTKKNDTFVNKGFYRSNDASFNVSLSTNLYGTWLFGSNMPLRGIKHVIRPNMSFSYKPNLNVHNYYYYVDSNKNQTKKSYFDGGINTPFSDNEFMGLNFGLTSSLEIKVRNRKDTVTGVKKISLIDNLSINGSYNLSKDTNNIRPLSVISISMGTNIAQKLNLNVNAIYDPYAKDSLGQISKKYAWQEKGFGWGALSNFSIALSTNFGSNNNNKLGIRKIKKLTLQEEKVLDFLYHDTSSLSNYNNYFQNWSINVSYNINYSNVYNTQTKTSMYKLGSHTLSLSGNIGLTSNWRVGFSSNLTLFDFSPEFFDKSKLNILSFNVVRDLHCWQLNATITPFGMVKSITFTFSPKSGMLRDLKIDKNRFYRE